MFHGRNRNREARKSPVFPGVWKLLKGLGRQESWASAQCQGPTSPTLLQLVGPGELLLAELIAATPSAVVSEGDQFRNEASAG